MTKVLWFLMGFGIISVRTSQTNFQPIQVSYSDYARCYHNPGVCTTSNIEANPILATLLLSSSLHLNPKIPGYNHYEHLPLNPYLALLLSHYGKYSPVFGKGRGLYGYVAANNYHNNKPFGAYKIYQDNDG